MQPTVKDRVQHCLPVGLSVSLLVCHNHEPCKNRGTDRDVIWVVAQVGSKKHVLDGVQIPHVKGQF